MRFPFDKLLLEMLNGPPLIIFIGDNLTNFRHEFKKKKRKLKIEINPREDFFFDFSSISSDELEFKRDAKAWSTKQMIVFPN